MGAFRRKIIGVFGDSKDPRAKSVAQIVPWIAQKNYHLLTGGRGGVMEEASKVFRQARDAAGTTGLVIGVLPDGKDENEWVEILIRTHLPGGPGTDDYKKGLHPRSRNWIEVRTCDVLVALQGGEGTKAEICLAVGHNTPVILFDWESSPLGGLEIQTSPTVVETQQASAVFSFIEEHTKAVTTLGKRTWNMCPSSSWD